MPVKHLSSESFSVTSPRGAEITVAGLSESEEITVAGLSESRVRVLESETPGKVASVRQLYATSSLLLLQTDFWP